MKEGKYNASYYLNCILVVSSKYGHVNYDTSSYNIYLVSLTCSYYQAALAESMLALNYKVLIDEYHDTEWYELILEAKRYHNSSFY